MTAMEMVEKAQLIERPRMKAGDTVKVHVRVKEGDKERIQIFEGVIIGLRRGGNRATFTVRKVSFSQGVERIFPLHSPTISKVEVVRSAKVRRAKLYFLRDLKGKAARMKEVKKTSYGKCRHGAQRARCLECAGRSPPAATLRTHSTATVSWRWRALTKSGGAVSPAPSWPAPSSCIPIAASTASPIRKPARPRSATRLHDEICRKCVSWAVVSVDPDEIDRINIHQATLQAMRRAVLSLAPLPDAVLVDAFRIPSLPMAQRGVIGGDRRASAIAAASIVAKVTRDRLMHALHDADPRYGFDRHKGYATADHLSAVARFGYSSQHRRTFRPATLFDTID